MIVLNKVSKTYTSKKGVKTVALNGVSLKLPTTGVVFIVGKSGAGKSTLLNVLGGLDYIDSGEIIINGKSTKDFSKNDYDSYRNTYVGFVFQECYVLNNLTVEENIGLAIKLQNKQVSSQEVSTILTQVGLDGYGARRINELSGGELQRVAIARALIKNPQIIIADEPTGSLDSNTGTQIFDILKSLSKDHLILVVSHEQEFAQRYADRIIEIKDGNIISDLTRTSFSKAKKNNKDIAGISFKNGSIVINPKHKLSASDITLINEFIVNKDKIKNSESTPKAKEYFVPTKDVDEEDDNKPMNLIKSKLPLKDSIRMGLNALKHKKFKLVMTILLSVISFTTLGLATLFTTFVKPVDLCAETFSSSVINFARIRKRLNDEESNSVGGNMGVEDQERLKEATGLNFSVLYTIRWSIDEYFSEESRGKIDDHYTPMFTNKAYVPLEYFNDANISSIVPEEDRPKEPLKDNEVAITEYFYEMFTKYGYCDKESRETIEIKNPEDILGKTLTYYEEDYSQTTVIIKDIYDTHFNRKDPFFNDFFNQKYRDQFYDTKGYAEYKDYEESLANTLFMSEDYVKTKIMPTIHGDEDMSTLIAGVPNNTRELMTKIYSFAEKKHPVTEQDKIDHEDYANGQAAYSVVDSVSWNIVMALEDTTTFRALFLLIGAAFALFSGLLLANFIANSISYQRKQIGILRAIGARGTDVFKIYFSESFFIATVNFVLSTLFTFLIFNGRIKAELLLLTNGIPIFTFGIIQVLIILGISFLAVFLATFIPIRHMAKRKPIDTIRLK